MNKNKTRMMTNVENDIFKQQHDTIADLRKQLEERDKHISYLSHFAEEYKEIKQIVGNNGLITWNEIFMVIQTRRNMAIQLERNRIDHERESARLAIQEAEHEELKRQVLTANPNLKKYCEDRKAKIQSTKDTATKLAEEFYLLEEDKAQQYFSLATNPNQIACKHLIEEITEGGEAAGSKRYIYYRCGYCQDTNYPTVSDITRHIWNNGEDHHDINLSRIENEAAKDTAKVNAEFLQDIENGIKAIKNKEYSKRLQVERTEQAKMKRSLPFVKADTKQRDRDRDKTNRGD